MGEIQSETRHRPGPSLTSRSTRRLAALFACALLGALSLAARAQAATYTVGTTTDATGTCTPTDGTCSLRQLIDYENGLSSTPSEPDKIVVPAGTYDLTNGPLVIEQSLNIAGDGARTTNIDQETTSSTSRVFDIEPNAALGLTPSVIISGVTMAYGKADATNGFFGGDVRNRGTLLLGEDVIENGQASSGSGGGISNDGGTLWLAHSLVTNNDSVGGDGRGGQAGGVENYGDPAVGAGMLDVYNSTIADNTGDAGGGVVSRCGGDGGACSGDGATNTTTIIDSTIAFNHGAASSTAGGGLLVTQGQVAVAQSILASNTATDPSRETRLHRTARRPILASSPRPATTSRAGRTAGSPPPAISRARTLVS